MSVVPTYAATLLATHNLAVLGAIPAVMLGTACAGQAVSLRLGIRPPIAQAAGLFTLVAGLAALVGAFPPRSLALLLGASVLTGAGLGVALVGVQTQINHLAPGERRGEVTAAFMTCVYLGVSCSAIGVGLLSDALSLSTAVAVMSVAITFLAVPTAIWHLGTAREDR